MSVSGNEPLHAHDVGDRPALVRRGQMLSMVTLAYNLVEGVVSVVAGALAGSVSRVGFGIDSGIESVSSVTALWRYRADAEFSRRQAVERTARRIIGVSFLLLAGYIAVESVSELRAGHAPQRTVPGIVIAGLSVVVMPILARKKRAVASALDSRALEADSTQTDLCSYLSAIVLLGLALNALLGWWWTDGVAGLVMTPIIAKEG